MSTPELVKPPELFYDEDEAAAYTNKSRNVTIQRELTERALELIGLDENNMEEQTPLILDIGCGSGLSGEIISEHGYDWIGLDIAPAMLDIASDHVDADLIRCDIGQRQCFRAGVFDGAISISVIQWLCHSFTNAQDPRKRLRVFFLWLYNSLRKGAKAALQFYVSHEEQTKLIAKSATSVGFVGGIVVDNEESQKNKKMYLLLSAGNVIAPLCAPVSSKVRENPKEHHQKVKKGGKLTGRGWILRKKAQQREKGLDVRPDTKYTGRKRPVNF